jgi:hypothetical protein
VFRVSFQLRLIYSEFARFAAHILANCTYIERSGGFIPNYGERYRNGERISTGFVESAVNQVVSKRMAKKQQMLSIATLNATGTGFGQIMCD